MRDIMDAPTIREHIDGISSCDCKKCTPVTNLHGLRVVFEGYASHVAEGLTESACPYPQRSSDAALWLHGVLWARHHLGARAAALVEQGPQDNGILADRDKSR